MMKKILIVAVILLCGSQLALAQIKQTQPMSDVLHKLKTKGYLVVKEIALKQDEYVASVLDDEGEAVEVHINAHSGEIISMKKINPHISTSDIVESIEQLGYGGITYIAAKDNYFIVTVLGPDGKPLQLTVDAVTGKITKSPVAKAPVTTP